MYEKIVRKAQKFIKTRILALKEIPQILKRPEVKKSILKIVFITITILIIALLALWIIKMLFAMLANLMDIYGIYITVIVLGILWLWNRKEGKRNEAQRQRAEEKQKELLSHKKDAVPKYNYLRNFMFRIFYDQNFCNLTELCRPLTANNLTENPPFCVDEKTGMVFYYFKVDKKSTQPLEKGVENILNLLQSVVLRKIETEGIEGISPPVRDSLISIIAVHDVMDCGSYVRIVIVFINEDYHETMQAHSSSYNIAMPKDKYLQ